MAIGATNGPSESVGSGRASGRGLSPLLPVILLAACAADAPPPPRWLQQVEVPGLLRPGSPLRACGAGLGATHLRISGGGPEVLALLDSVAVSDGGGGSCWSGRVLPADAADGAVFSRACAEIETVDAAKGREECVDVTARWWLGLTAGAVPPPSALAWRHGALLPVTTAAQSPLLLPGEGSAWLRIAAAGTSAAGSSAAIAMPASATVAVAVEWPGSRHTGEVTVGPAWLGLAPGARLLRWRLEQRAGEAVSLGPWSADFTIDVLPPHLGPLPDAADRGLRRGERLPVQVDGVPVTSMGTGWAVIVWGTWRDSAGGVTAVWSPSAARLARGRSAVPGAAARFAVVDSVDFLADGWQTLLATAGEPPRLEGEIALLLWHQGQEWRGPAQSVSWPLRPTVQHISLEMGGAFELGLEAFGLRGQSQAVRAGVRARVQELFGGWAVSVASQQPAGVVEGLRIAVLDRDPNGIGLLGADNSPGKDDGNRILDEALIGYAAATATAGNAPYGGVFVEGFLQFSLTLNAGSPLADVAFDTIFGPFAPQLGGTPVVATAQAAAISELATTTLVELLAGTIAHEVGHALGLAAGDLVHHADDHPGWIMDAGVARPFAERARLPGAAEPIWGPLDGAYLSAILPLPAGTPPRIPWPADVP